MITPKRIAVEAVKKAGAILLGLSQSEINYKLKSSHDVLAEGDLLSEKIIIESIKNAFPSHGFLSEEAGKKGASDHMWIIDPIDGTINFSRHIEEYCISVALIYKGILELGVIYQPGLNKLYVAERGRGAFLNGEGIKVSTETKLVNSLLATDNSSKLESRQQNFKILNNLCLEVRHIRIFGSGALHLARIAEGKIDAYFKTRLNYWDYAAGLLLVQEAGGKASDFNGNSISEKSENIMVSNGLIHTNILGLLNKSVLFTN